MRAIVRYRRVGALLWHKLPVVVDMDYTWTEASRPRGFDPKKGRPTNVQNFYTQWQVRAFRFEDGTYAEIPATEVEFRIRVLAEPKPLVQPTEPAES